MCHGARRKAGGSGRDVVMWFRCSVLLNPQDVREVPRDTGPVLNVDWHAFTTSPENVPVRDVPPDSHHPGRLILTSLMHSENVTLASLEPDYSNAEPAESWRT
jgi:hypothetical protein